MSEFEKELEKNMELNKVAYAKENFYSDFLVSKRDIERVFHDWQPPKPLVVVPQCVADWFRGLSYNRLEKYILNDVRKMNEKEVYLFTDFEKWFIASENPIETILKMKDGYEVEEK